MKKITALFLLTLMLISILPTNILLAEELVEEVIQPIENSQEEAPIEELIVEEPTGEIIEEPVEEPVQEPIEEPAETEIPGVPNMMAPIEVKGKEGTSTINKTGTGLGTATYLRNHNGNEYYTTITIVPAKDSQISSITILKNKENVPVSLDNNGQQTINHVKEDNIVVTVVFDLINIAKSTITSITGSGTATLSRVATKTTVNVNPGTNYELGEIEWKYASESNYTKYFNNATPTHHSESSYDIEHDEDKNVDIKVTFVGKWYKVTVASYSSKDFYFAATNTNARINLDGITNSDKTLVLGGFYNNNTKVFDENGYKVPETATTDMTVIAKWIPKPAVSTITSIKGTGTATIKRKYGTLTTIEVNPGSGYELGQITYNYKGNASKTNIYGEEYKYTHIGTTTTLISINHPEDKYYTDCEVAITFVPKWFKVTVEGYASKTKIFAATTTDMSIDPSGVTSSTQGAILEGFYIGETIVFDNNGKKANSYTITGEDIEVTPSFAEMDNRATITIIGEGSVNSIVTSSNNGKTSTIKVDPGQGYELGKIEYKVGNGDFINVVKSTWEHLGNVYKINHNQNKKTNYEVRVTFVPKWYKVSLTKEIVVREIELPSIMGKKEPVLTESVVNYRVYLASNCNIYFNSTDTNFGTYNEKAPTKDKYAFNGFYVGETLAFDKDGKAKGAYKTLATDTSVIAKFDLNTEIKATYTNFVYASVSDSGGSAAIIKEELLGDDVTVKQTVKVTVNDGYIIDDVKVETATGTIIADYDSENDVFTYNVPLKSHIEVKAYFEPGYTVTLDPGRGSWKGSGDGKAKKVIKLKASATSINVRKDTVKIDLEIPGQYDFMGYFNGQDKYFDNNGSATNLKITSNTTLTAKFVVKGAGVIRMATGTDDGKKVFHDKYEDEYFTNHIKANFNQRRSAILHILETNQVLTKLYFAYDKSGVDYFDKLDLYDYYTVDVASNSQYLFNTAVDNGNPTDVSGYVYAEFADRISNVSINFNDGDRIQANDSHKAKASDTVIAYDLASGTGLPKVVRDKIAEFSGSGTDYIFLGLFSAKNDLEGIAVQYYASNCDLIENVPAGATVYARYLIADKKNPGITTVVVKPSPEMGTVTHYVYEDVIKNGGNLYRDIKLYIDTLENHSLRALWFEHDTYAEYLYLATATEITATKTNIWYANATEDAANDEYTFVDIPLTENAVVYATFGENPQIIYENVVASNTYLEYNSAIGDKLIASPTKTGYNFKGWFEDSAYTKTLSLTEKRVADVHVYASFTEIPKDEPEQKDQPEQKKESSNDDSNTNTTFTVPVEGDKDAVNINATISGNDVSVNTIKEEELEKVNNEDKVVIDLTGIKKDIDSVTLTKESVENIANSDAAGLEIQFPDGTIASFDKAAVDAINEQAKGNTIKLNIDEAAKVTNMTEEQTETVKEMDNTVVIDAYLTSNGERISNFKGGKVVITIPYTKTSAGEVKGAYVDEKGNMESVPTTFKADPESTTGEGVAELTIEHFSHYVVFTGDTVLPVIPVEKNDILVDTVNNKYYVNNESFDAVAEIFIEKGRTYLGIRDMAKALGVKDEDITWDDSAKTAKIVLAGAELYITQGVDVVKLVYDNETYYIPTDATAKIKEDRIYLPFRKVFEIFGYTVEWYQDTKTITCK